MSIFQKSVVNKYLKTLDLEKVNIAYKIFQSYFSDKLRLFNIMLLKEENYQEGFLRELFVDVLGYTINPNKDYNLTTEFKNQTDSKKADGAILCEGKAIGVIELKSTKLFDLKQIEKQAFNYKNNQPNCRFVITSTFHFIRLYIDNLTDFEEFDLFYLEEEDFRRLYLFLSKDSIFNNIPLRLKEETKFHEESISDKFYKDYRQFKEKIFENIIKRNTQFDRVLLLRKTQKLLDRILFIAFAEDKGLIPPNALSRTVEKWKIYINEGDKVSLYSRYRLFFHHLNIGFTYKDWGIVPAYNGGLFFPDEVLDSKDLIIEDNIIKEGVLSISKYDFNTEIDVNILGHIFEHSLNEMDEIIASNLGQTIDLKQSKRKKDGIFYTPDYITKYIVTNTIGELCKQKKQELLIHEILIDESHNKNGKITKKGKELFEIIKTYKNWLFELKILDPACGSGAFLIQALDFLIQEHKETDELIYQLTGESIKFFDTDKTVLEKNIYGVDINDESVEIAKLSLWLHTAKKERKLSDLSQNFKCGNSLIDNREIAGDKAFNWNTEFPDIMKNGGFDVVIGNPPYVFTRGNEYFNTFKEFIWTKYVANKGKINLYGVFLELSLANLLKKEGYLGFITPETFIRTSTYANIRKFVYKKFNIQKIEIYGIGVFDNVTAEAITMIIQHTYDKNHEIVFTKRSKNSDICFTVKQDSFDNTPQNRFVFNTSFKDDLLFDKLKINSISLGSIVDTRNGVATKAGKKDFISPNKLTDKYKKLLEAPEIYRYGYIWSGNYINYDKEALHRPRKEETFLSEKILIQRVASKLVCTFDNEQFYTFNSINNLVLINNEFSLKYILVLLNSKLINYLYRKHFSLDANFTITVTKENLDILPIKNLNLENQKQFIEKADKMLSLNRALQLKIEKFIKRIKSNFTSINLNTRLYDFYKFDFKTFVTEIKKQKTELNLKQQDEWEEYFESYKKDINEIQFEVSNTDKIINKMVYELYELSFEEIKIVEELI